jgi:hypothetical protein
MRQTDVVKTFKKVAEACAHRVRGSSIRLAPVAVGGVRARMHGTTGDGTEFAPCLQATRLPRREKASAKGASGKRNAYVVVRD